MNQNWVLYALAALALIYLAFPHVVECYQAYARPWNTEERMTNADVAKKLRTYQEGFEEGNLETDPELSDVLPGEDKAVAVVGPSNKKEVEPAIDKTDYETPSAELLAADTSPTETKAVDRMLDTEVQQPKPKEPKKPAPKIVKANPMYAPVPEMPSLPPVKTAGQKIKGPRAPRIDPNEPSATDHGSGKNKAGVYPHIYGPDLLVAPGAKDEDSSNPTMFDFIPAAEFPAGPLSPSPYLNDFSKILKAQ